MTHVLMAIALALVAAVAAKLVAEDVRLFRASRRRTVGEVVDHRRSVDDGAEYYMARIRYRDGQGSAHEFEDTVGRTRPAPPVGTSVPVVHAVGPPFDARIPRPFLRAGLYTFVFGTGGVLAAKALGLIGG